MSLRFSAKARCIQSLTDILPPAQSRSMSLSISIAISLAPPWSGPLSAPMPPQTALCMSVSVDEIVRHEKVEALKSCSA